ncbi:MAG: asparagine--tRNA ligase [Spirochaetes bacterium GWD1_61_31]|nr:MAG: asparagine--tRNA ligase [Spirochaetes bacterium GWB1_60_80]OHD34265.1 MAG: asparagine--tRNA ligase [Spirochaetes bacterium GWC1_61_12]OHD40193.1 MAG: asparagine--tRNA ligase [Spirochaetes bacterium GWD1_61_31]OHD45759.1 MAG: asparagine--tRNA ligase [Spirochaetes bacterium GWE1_60_18]OHD58303.1 MAG: asparagine--tRNA ligase [Spirochaetes bacterium GWF1_60_12]HAX37789.1 asparagine--tRNA ligase [Spirochaetaceae bacterium]
MFTRTDRLQERISDQASLRGWLCSRQDRGKVIFLTLRDGHGTSQVVCSRDQLGDDQFCACKSAPLESALSVTGLVSLPTGKPIAELLATSIIILPSEPGFPIGRKDHGPDFLMDQRHLWIRSAKQAAILRIRSSLEFACVSFLQRAGFHRFDAPLITPTSCEGTTELFKLDYFGNPAFLSQSAQLYSEAGIAALEKVYSLGPCFRAEKSITRRHLTEFWGVEPEMAWVEAEENMQFQEQFIRGILEIVAAEREADLLLLERNPSDLRFPSGCFEVVLYDDVIKRLAVKGRDLSWGSDLSVEDEEALSVDFDRPFFIYKYPVQCRAFYIEADPKRPEVALSSDCLMPDGFGEIITGGQRAADYDFLRQRLAEHGLDEATFNWYLDLRRFGSVPHSGFGMGIERMLRWICGLHHIRETIPFARTPQRCSP